MAILELKVTQGSLASLDFLDRKEQVDSLGHQEKMGFLESAASRVIEASLDFPV
jgi:hypothetical protein